MALRLIEIFVPRQNAERLQQLLQERSVLGVWQDSMTETHVLVKVLLPGEDTEAVLDELERAFRGVKDFRVVLLAVEASIPRAEPAEEEAAEPAPGAPKRPARTAGRISPDEAAR